MAAIKDASDAFLGIGKVDIITGSIILNTNVPGRRAQNDAHINTLVNSYNVNGCLSDHPQNYIIIGVQRECVDLGSLSPIGTTSPSAVRFTEKAKTTPPNVLNGVHRLVARNKQLAPAVESYKALVAKRDGVPQNGDGSALETEFATAKSLLKEARFWTAMVYDQGVCSYRSGRFYQ